MNNWKIVSIVLMIVLVIEIGLLIQQRTATYDFGTGGIIKKSTVNDLSTVMNDEPFRICNTENNNCFVVGKLK